MSKSGPEYLRSKSKRRLDVLGGAAIGLALLPAEAAAYSAAAVDNKSLLPFFTQDRVGQNEENIRISKFRTLRPHLVDPTLPGRGAYDPRASVTGQILRRFGLDEIPQLISVVDGEMSLLGIRATTELGIKDYEAAAPDFFNEWLEAYHTGKPSLIGPGQIFRYRFRVRNEEAIRQSLRMDIDYTKNASIINDLRILGSAPLKLLAANLHPVKEQTDTQPATTPI